MARVEMAGVQRGATHSDSAPLVLARLSNDMLGTRLIQQCTAHAASSAKVLGVK